ncbi:MAG: DNA translocase FtsK, partial [Clostridia bacterium]|nr:DNA translocase FtsK [Clostridia bacterium]
SRVANTSDNLALELKTKHVRVEAPIQGTNYIGIEVPNNLVSTVALREVLDSPEMRSHPSPLLVALGKDIAGSPVLCDLSKMPHLLIAGATGSGKSVCINSIVCSLLYRVSPDQVRLIMIDPKQVELSVYNTIPHLLVPVISDPKKAAGSLAWVVQEMLERYGKFSAQGVRNLAGYNKANQGTDKVLPNIVVIIDEMADLMEVCRKDVEESIRRLAALARAAGIYMVLATQRPSVDVITGVIKNNIPSRIAFAVSSGTDSRTIIDINGAEKLMGKGDMLYKPAGASAQRVQGCLVTDDEVNAIAEYIGARYQTDFDPNIVDHLENTGKDHDADEVTGGSMDDAGGGGEGSFQDLLQQAIEMAVEDGSTSTSMLQRRLRVGYARAGRLIDEMEKRGIISQSEGSKPRKTIITREQYYELMGNQ